MSALAARPPSPVAPHDERAGLLLSVIVPCFNVADYLDRCLTSLRDQDLRRDEYEIIVIDDGSTDDTGRVAEEHAARDPRIKVHSQSNQGLSAARNAGLERAIGAYVYFVDGDDHVATGSLRGVVEAMRERSLDIAKVRARRIEPQTVVARRPSVDGAVAVTEVVTGVDFLAERHSVDGVWQYVFDRRFLRRVGIRFEVGRLFEDQLFNAEALTAAQRVARVDQDVYRYVIREGSIMRSSGSDHTRRLLRDFEHVIVGFGELRRRKAAEGTSTPAFLDRLTLLQQICAFFLIARIIRAPDVPLRPVLGETLRRLRSVHAYPMTAFPGSDHPGPLYRVLTSVFNRGPLVYPFAYAYRAAMRVTGWLATLEVRRTAIVLFAVVGVIALVGSVAAWLDPDHPWLSLDAEIDLDWPPTEATLALPAVWSAVTIAFGGIAWVGVGSLGGRVATSVAALGFGTLLLLLAGDELFILHERIEYRTGIDWQLIYAPFGAAGAALLGTLASRVRGERPGVAAMLVMGAVCWGVAAGLEFVQWRGDEEVALYTLLMIPEEVLELTGSALFALAGIAMLHANLSVPSDRPRDASHRG